MSPSCLGELADLGVALVDQLAAVLGDLAVGEVTAPGPAAPAEPVGCLVDRRDVPGLLEPVGARQAGQARRRRDDPGSGGGACRRRQASEGRKPDAGGACPA